MSKPLSDSASGGRALFLSPEAPYPTVGGGALRSASLLEYLTRHYDVDCIFFEHSHAPHPAAAVPAGKIQRMEIVRLPEHSRATLARTVRNASRFVRNRPPLFDRFSGFGDRIAAFVLGQSYDVTVIEHFWCAAYVSELRPVSRLTVIDLHNIESVWHRRLALTSGPIAAGMHQRFAASYAALESEWLPRYDRILVTSGVDARQLQPMVDAARVTLYPNAIPETPSPQRCEEHCIAFTGNLEYEPNRQAIAHFQAQIWPLLRDRFPGLVWRLIGKNPHSVEKLVAADPSIELVGPVDDAIASLATAKVAVVPLLAGSGTRIKILEAWAAGTPVVSTSLGAEGLDCRAGEHLYVTDDPNSFANFVGELLSSSQLRQQMGQAGRQLCQERYTWEAAWSGLDRVFTG